MAENPLTTVHETAEALGVPVRWLKAEATAGRVPCLRVSARQTFFNLEAVRSALAEQAAENRLEAAPSSTPSPPQIAGATRSRTPATERGQGAVS